MTLSEESCSTRIILPMRNSLPYFVVLLLLLSLAGFAWLSAHPAHPNIDRAMTWPGVGWAARWFRSVYPIAPPSSESTQGARQARAEPLDVHPEIWLEPGTILRERPLKLAAANSEVRSLTNAVLLERNESWYLVETARQGRGWAHLPDYIEPSRPIFGSGLIAAGPLAPRAADPERLALARELLGKAAIERSLGPYVLWTDVDDPVLWARGEELVAGSEVLYAQRYGVMPIEKPLEAIVVFSREAAYQRFLASDGADGVSGHTQGGLITLQNEHRLREEILATLAHEVAHLLNRRALGPALPRWLEEGIAEDFASQLSRPLVITDEDGWWASGPGAAPLLLRQAEARGAAPTLEVLTSSEGEIALLNPQVRALYYSAAGLWIRFLVRPEEGAGFESYLEGIASGGPFGLEALEAAMAADASKLEKDFWIWFAEL